MRYLITNPDSFGDVVLRQPLFTRLLDAGHEVALLVKKSYSTIVHFLDPRLKMFMIDDLNPYVITVLDGKDNVNAVLDEVAAYNPDVVVVAPYQRTLIDNWTLERFSKKKTIGMKGIEVDYEEGVRVFRPVTRQTKKLLHVPENLSEVEKNRRLLSLCLGKEVRDYQPRLKLPAASRSLAETTLKQLQLKKNDFIICAPGGASVPLKQYPAVHFSHILKHWAQTYERKVLLVGNRYEQSTLEEISASLRKSRVSTSTWIGNETELEVLLGLISLSKVYFGNDTGPMHFAAAFGKPVIAIFGGGHWPRFVPAAKEGGVILQELPCFGCGWQCIFEKAICIQSIDEQRIVDAVDLFEGGKMKQFKILAKPFEGDIGSLWIQEAKEKMKSYKGQIESTRVEREKESRRFEQKVKSLTDEVQVSSGNASKIQDRVQVLETQNQNYQTELSQAKQLVDAKNEEIRLLHNQVQEHLQRMDALSLRFEHEHEDNVRLKEHLVKDEVTTESLKQQLQLSTEKCRLIADQIESEKHFTAAVSKQLEEQKQSNDSLLKQIEEEKNMRSKLSKQLEEKEQLNGALAKQVEEGKELNAALTKQAQEEKNLKLAITKQLEEEKLLNRALANEIDDGKRVSASLRKEFDEEKQLNIALTNELDEEKRSTISLRKQVDDEKNLNLKFSKQLEEEKRQSDALTKQVNEEKSLNLKFSKQLEDEKSLNLKLATQVKSNEEKIRLLQVQLSEQADQLKKEKEVQTQLQSRLKAHEENSRTLQSQIGRNNDQLRNLTVQLEAERRTSLNLKNELAEAGEQLKQKSRTIKDTAGNLRDLKPKLEELHLTVRQQEENMQQIGESLTALMKSGWIRLGIRAGIPWLSRWHYQMFGTRSLDGVFPSSGQKFQDIVSYKEHIRTRIDEIASTLS